MKFFKLLLVLLLLHNLLNAQNNDYNSIDDLTYRLVKNMRSSDAEKIIIVTNKKVYNLNDNIFYKAFLVDSVTGRFTNKSNILFADLVDKNDKVIHSSVLNFSGGQQTGIFYPDSSLNGYYWIRAYTRNILSKNIKNILNKDVNTVTLCPVYIFNSGSRLLTNKIDQSKPVSTTSAGKPPVITLYPEGGNLMSGAQMMVGIRATSTDGKAIADSGFIKDNQNTTQARFVTNEEGIGKFALDPSAYRKYTVFFKTNGKYDSVKNLPPVYSFSGQLAITEQTPENIKVRVLLEDSIFKKDYKTFIIALHNDSVCAAATGQGMYQFNISSSSFPSGISNLLLFNADGKLVSERNVYINKSDVNIKINTDKQNYSARENVSLKINITNNDGKAVAAAFSVAVNDSRVADTINNFSADALQNLSADEADLIMLTQQNKDADYFRSVYSLKNDASIKPDSSALFIKGVLIDKKGNLVPGKSITLLSLDNSNLILQDSTNKTGKFSIASPDFNTGTAFSLQINNEKSARDAYDVVLEPAFKNNFKTPAYLKEKFSQEEFANIQKTESFYIDSMLTGKGWLPHVIVKGSVNNDNFSSNDVITKETLHSGSLNNVGDAILQNGKFHIYGGFLLTGGTTGITPSASDEPIIVVDGVQVSNSGGLSNSLLDFLRSIPTTDIDHIKLLTGVGASSYGFRSGGGVIEISTLSKAVDVVSNSTLKIIYPKGFDAPPAFTMPDYTIKQIKNSKEPDVRTSIYWNGNIITDANGNATMNFFTADAPAVYYITITGITANGIKFYKTATISRK